MKKIFSALIMISLILPLIVICPAEALQESDLPFDNAAPTHIAATWLEGHDSPTTMSLTFTIDDSIAEFYMAREEASQNDAYDEFMAQYPFYDIRTDVQIASALDDVNDEESGWHYTQYWDYNNIEGDYWSIGVDEEWNWRCGPWDMVNWGLGNACYTAQDYWVTRWVNEDEFYGDPETGRPGLKDQLREGQYTYEVEEEGYDPVLRIDFTEHTMYFRARLYTVLTYEDGEGVERQSCIFSDWSDTCGYGKDIAKIEPLKPGEVDAPVITNLVNLGILDEDDCPTVAFTLTVPDKLAEQAANQSALGRSLYIEIWARVKGDTEWAEVQGDRDITAGQHKAWLYALQTEERPIVTVDAIIELRCRYAYDYDDEYTGWDLYHSGWSNIITFGGDDVGGYGDVNGDGKVNGQDLVRLRKYLNGENVAITEGANVNGDVNNLVNGQDLIRLRNYLSTYDLSLLGPKN